MQSKVKLTKRQVKEDKFTTFMLESKDQLQENWQKIVVGLLAVVVLIVAVSYYFTSRTQTTEDASVRFANAMLDYQRGDNDVAILGFAEIIDKYASSQAAEDATYLLGQINLNQFKYDEAKRYFEMYLSKYRENAFRRAASQAGLAAVAEDQAVDAAAYAAAAALFEKAIDEDPEGPLAPDYHLGAVRTYLAAGNDEAAKKHLDILQEKYPDTGHAHRAMLMYSEKAATPQS